MMRNSPRVSIGLPVYNGERFLEETLDSILSQTFHNFELIISDNASTDRTEDICRIYTEKDNRIRYFRNEVNLGAAKNYNRVFDLASAEYFKWAAHDDIYDPTFLEQCVNVLDCDPSVILCFSKTRCINEYGKSIDDYNHNLRTDSAKTSERFLNLICSNHIIVEIFGLARTSILKRTPCIGNYVSSDRVLLGELSLYGRFFEVPEYLFFHREHEERSTRVYLELHSRTAWFDPARADKIVLPMWRQIFEHLASIYRVPLTLGEKMCRTIDVLRVARWRQNELALELLKGITLCLAAVSKPHVA